MNPAQAQHFIQHARAGLLILMAVTLAFPLFLFWLSSHRREQYAYRDDPRSIGGFLVACGVILIAAYVMAS